MDRTIDHAEPTIPQKPRLCICFNMAGHVSNSDGYYMWPGFRGYNRMVDEQVAPALEKWGKDFQLRYDVRNPAGCWPEDGHMDFALPALDPAGVMHEFALPFRQLGTDFPGVRGTAYLGNLTGRVKPDGAGYLDKLWSDGFANQWLATVHLAMSHVMDAGMDLVIDTLFSNARLEHSDDRLSLIMQQLQQRTPDAKLFGEPVAMSEGIHRWALVNNIGTYAIYNNMIRAMDRLTYPALCLFNNRSIKTHSLSVADCVKWANAQDGEVWPLLEPHNLARMTPEELLEEVQQ